MVGVIRTALRAGVAITGNDGDDDDDRVDGGEKLIW